MSQLSNRIGRLEEQTQAKCEAITVKTIVHYEDEDIAASEKVCECGRVFHLLILTLERGTQAAA